MPVAGVGNTAELSRLRQGTAETSSGGMSVAPDDPPSELGRLGEDTPLPGLAVARINPAVIAATGLPLSATGVVVVELGPYGARAGLQPGDVLQDINGVEIAHPSDVEAGLSEGGRWLNMDLLRQGQTLRLRLRL
jgi:S1-C subfamily serine protease